jgi:hypothetical protein
MAAYDFDPMAVGYEKGIPQHLKFWELDDQKKDRSQVSSLFESLRIVKCWKIIVENT